MIGGPEAQNRRGNLGCDTMEPISGEAKVQLDSEQRRALELLVSAQRGLTDATLKRVHGFTLNLLAGLVRSHLVTVTECE
jgi:hypothetical protein